MLIHLYTNAGLNQILTIRHKNKHVSIKMGFYFNKETQILIDKIIIKTDQITKVKQIKP